MPRRLAGLEGLDCDHAAAAAWTDALRSVRLVPSGLLVIGVLLLWRRRGEQLAGQCDIGGAVAVGEKAEVSNAVEAPGQDVDEEAADELGRCQGHGLVALAAFDAVILVSEGDACRIGLDQAAVGYGDPVGIARQVGQHGPGPAEGPFGIDHPFGLAQRLEEGGKGGPVGQALMIAEEGQAVLVMGSGQHRQHQAPEEAREHPHRQEEARSAGDPPLPVHGQAAAGYDHVHMRMVGHRRTPCVQHGCDADPGAEMLRVGGNGQHRLGAGPEQDIVDRLLVLVCDVGERRRQGEDDMVVGHRQEIGLASLQPVACDGALALRAMPVAAGIVGDACMVAVLALFHMAAERRGAAALDGAHRLQLAEADMAGIGHTPCRPVIAEDIRDLQSRTGHGGGALRRLALLAPGLFAFGSAPLAGHCVERALHTGDEAGGDTCIAGCRIQLGMAEQGLDAPYIRA